MTQTSVVPSPFNDNIVVVEHHLEDVTPSGIHLPQQQQSPILRTATVVAIGPGKLYPDGSRSRMDVQVGDEVYYNRLTGVEIKYEQGEYLVMSQKAIIALTRDDS